MRGGLLSISLFLIGGGVLTQALLAGFFISGTGGARLIHVIVGAILPYLAIVPTVAAWRRKGQGLLTRGYAVATTLLLAGLWVQEGLGHMPFAVATVIHVPLGVLLFAGSLQLAIGARQGQGETTS